MAACVVTGKIKRGAERRREKGLQRTSNLFGPSPHLNIVSLCVFENIYWHEILGRINAMVCSVIVVCTPPWCHLRACQAVSAAESPSSVLPSWASLEEFRRDWCPSPDLPDFPARQFASFTVWPASTRTPTPVRQCQPQSQPSFNQSMVPSLSFSYCSSTERILRSPSGVLR